MHPQVASGIQPTVSRKGHDDPHNSGHRPASRDSSHQEPRLLAAGPDAGWAQHLETFGP